MSALILPRLYKTIPKQIRFTTEKHKLLRQVIQVPGFVSLKESSTLTGTQNQDVYRHNITKTIKFITREQAELKFDQRTFKLANPTSKSLCVLLTWMNAVDKHKERYVNIYLEQGFDVLTVALPTSDILWPSSGSQVTAAHLLKFLHNNTSATLMLHGFSAGVCMWGEVSHIISTNKEKYQSIKDRVACQVWESAIDFETSQLGLPIALFPKSILLQRVASIYCKLHLLIFYGSYTKFMQRVCSEYLHRPCLAPALILVSSTDPLAPEATNRMLCEKWKSLGIEVTFKCWDKTPHVMHFAKQPKEYLTLLYNHMDQAGLLKDRVKMNARLSSM